MSAARTGYERHAQESFRLRSHRNRHRRRLLIWSRRTSSRRRSTSNGGESFHRQNQNAQDISNHYAQDRDQRVQVPSLHLRTVHLPLRVRTELTESTESRLDSTS